MKKNIFFNVAYFSILGISAVWLGYAATVVDIDNYDSYDTINNTLYFTGEASTYFSNRPPFFSFILIPARILSKKLNYSNLDVQPYHFEVALIHFLYLFFVLFYLKKEFGKDLAILVAFLSAITNVVFFLLAPFLSHDLFPGALFLIMLVLTHAYIQDPKNSLWIALILLGTIAALTKVMFGLFWFAVLIASLFLLKEKKILFPTFLRLVIASVLSAVLYWIVMAFVLSNSYPSSSFLLRPWTQITFISANDFKHPWWIYLVNFRFYGTLTMLLILPGLWMAIRKNSFYRLVAISWIVSFFVIHLIHFRETRYLAFLMPLSAILIVLPLQTLLSKKRFILPILLFLVFDLYSSFNEASLVQENFYQKSQIKAFTSILNAETSQFIFFGLLATMPPTPLSFSGDMYHRIFYFSRVHLNLLGYKQIPEPKENQEIYAYDYPNTALFYIPSHLVNATKWEIPKSTLGLSRFKAYACISSRIPITSQSGKWMLGNEEIVKFEKKAPQELTQIQSPSMDSLFQQYLFPCVTHRQKKITYPILKHESQSNTYMIPTYNLNQFSPLEEWEFWGYRIKKMLVSKPDQLGTHLLSFEE